jgi:hypothetical protein
MKQFLPIALSGPLQFAILFSLWLPLWLLITAIINKKAGMRRHLNVEMGAFICESKLGSGSINGVMFGKCLRVHVYEHGWLLTKMLICGGGKFWLPRNTTKIEPIQKGSFFCSDYRVLTSSNDCVTLGGALANFVTDDGTEFTKVKPAHKSIAIY